MLAAADQELDGAMPNHERLRRELAGVFVAAGPRVQQPLAFKPADRHLTGRRPLGWPTLECRAFDFPFGERVGLEVLEHFVRPLPARDLFRILRLRRSVHDFIRGEQVVGKTGPFAFDRGVCFRCRLAAIFELSACEPLPLPLNVGDRRVDLAVRIEIRRLPP